MEPQETKRSIMEIFLSLTKRLGNILISVILLIIYFYLVVMSSMLFDSCGAGADHGSCSILSFVYGLNVFIFIGTLFFGVIFNAIAPVLFRRILEKHRWVTIFSPGAAISFFLISMISTMFLLSVFGF